MFSRHPLAQRCRKPLKVEGQEQLARRLIWRQLGQHGVHHVCWPPVTQLHGVQELGEQGVVHRNVSLQQASLKELIQIGCGSGDGLQEVAVRSDHLLRKSQDQAAVPRHTANNVVLIKQDFNLLEVNHRLLGPKDGQLEIITNPVQLLSGQRRQLGVQERGCQRHCEQIHQRTSARRLAGECGSGSEK